MSIQSALGRLEAHAKALLLGGAPHQQSLAEDINLVSEHVKAMSQPQATPPIPAESAESADLNVPLAVQVEELKAQLATALEDNKTMAAQIAEYSEKIAEFEKRQIDVAARPPQPDPSEEVVKAVAAAAEMPPTP